MKERTLSSAQTFWMKFVFPTIWISMFGLGTLALFLGSFRGADNSLPPEIMKWGFLAAWIAGTIFIYWTCARLKRVRIEDSAIYASNYLKEIRISARSRLSITTKRRARSPDLVSPFSDGPFLRTFGGAKFLAQVLEGQVNHRRRVERERLRDDQTADDGDAERTA